MRHRETIDQELRLLAAVRTATREFGGRPTTEAADELLYERIQATPSGQVEFSL